MNITQIKLIAEEIVQNLTVSAKTTSRYYRTLVSARDSRRSSMWIGVSGSLCCGVVVLAVLLVDLTNLCIKKSAILSNDIETH